MANWSSPSPGSRHSEPPQYDGHYSSIYSYTFRPSERSPAHIITSKQHGEQEDDLGISSPQSNPTFSPSSPGVRRTSGQSRKYSQIPQWDPYTIPQRKSVGSLTSKAPSVSTLEMASSRMASDPDLQYLIERQAEEIAQWRIHWWTPTSMVVLFILGILGAVSHHLFYTSLDGKEADNQLQKIRYGTALAFFTKMTLVGSVVVCYRQRIWYTLRRKAMTLSAIDALFAVTEDPTRFRTWEMIKNSKLSTLMAVATWFIPIAAVLSPASLTTTISVLNNSTACRAANLNFTSESYNDFRHPKNISGFYGISLSYYNTTDVNATTPGWFDYWDQPSKNALRLSVMSVYSNKPVERDDAATSACGAGWNCSYSISFTGPGYQCSEIASGVGSNDSVLQLIGAPFNTSSLVPAGINIYKAVVDNGDYLDPQLPTNSKGQPIEGPPWPEGLGAFKTEPKLWIGYTVDSNQPLPSNSPFAGRWKTVQTPKIFTCDHYETQYSVLFNYSEGHQSTTVTNRIFLNPIVDTALAQFPNGTLDPSTIEPASNYVFPTRDVPHYKLTAAYHALGHLFRAWLRGTIELEQSWPLTRSDVSETRLIDKRIYWPIPDLQDQLQSLYEDLLLSLLSDTHLIIGTNTTVPCTKSRHVNLFQYHARALWLGYAIVILVTLIFLGVGFAAMLENGVVSGTSFSRILVTTRNPALDRLSVGACLGSDPFPAGLMRTKFRFGVLDDSDADCGLQRDEALVGGERVAHCAFGTEAQTRQIVKGRTYAGLRGIALIKKKMD